MKKRLNHMKKCLDHMKKCLNHMKKCLDHMKKCLFPPKIRQHSRKNRVLLRKNDRSFVPIYCIMAQ